MKTLVLTSTIVLASTLLLTALVPTASADGCVVNDTGCVCVVNVPPGEGCGPNNNCFAAVGLTRAQMIGLGCV